MVRKQDKSQNLIKCEYCDKLLNNTTKSIGCHIGYWHKDKTQELYHQPYKFTIVCLECNELVANSNNVLSRHLQVKHNIKYVDYIIKYKHNNVWPICKCGCGEKLRFCRGYNGNNFAQFIKD